jgi:hypothetical protein
MKNSNISEKLSIVKSTVSYLQKNNIYEGLLVKSGGGGPPTTISF